MTSEPLQNRIESHNQLAIQQALSLCHRHQHPVSLLALDVAELDKLRADIGEARMETLVSLLAEHLQQYKRCEDLLITNADNHVMLVVLPATDVRGGHQLAKRLLSRFASEEFQLDEFQVEVSLRIALHGCEQLESADPYPLIDATLAILESVGSLGSVESGDDAQLLLSDQAREALNVPLEPTETLTANLLSQARRKGDNELLDALKPALSELPESERMKLVDHLLDLSTGIGSGLSGH
ncbi:diguanylate cyclase [Alcanivorax sp. S6407]|uniref:diguanylate cyclase domain-containing protein n=1 Tax=Alcanivorax sp. S6407 TaxID=2926424 RepID=UPI001FF29E8C|nr:diguanylate cyclase [Alcanivorax sp. S6407]MCK0152784.1 diguanylate cyclase [Alcanivorax sp. S6407]